MRQTAPITNPEKIYQRAVHQDIRASLYPAHIKIAKDNGYKFIKYDDVDKHDKFFILRHDIDMDLRLAGEMAKLEHAAGVTATYFIMLHNELYNTGALAHRKVLREMRDLGHTVGLHFDPTVWAPYKTKNLPRLIEKEIHWLSELAETQVHWVSFHQPDSYFLNNDVVGEGFESVYNSRFTRGMRYIADSMGMWREESISELLQRNDTPKIQFLSHPANWFNEEAVTLNERMGCLVAQQQARLPHIFAHAINAPPRNLVLYAPGEK